MPAQGAFRAFPSSACPRTRERRWRRWCSPEAIPLDHRWHDTLPATRTSIAADSGLEHVHALGSPRDLVVGDLDSVRPDDARAGDRATAPSSRSTPPTRTRPTSSSRSAPRSAAGATRVIVVGAGGGRLDHFLANVLLLAAPDWAGLRAPRAGRRRPRRGRARPHELRGAVGSIVSLLAPAGDPARGIATSGLRWPLRDDELLPGSTRGVSNEMTDPVATVTLTDGVLARDPARRRPGPVAPSDGGT